MDEKEKTILDTAITVYAKKGFNTLSMQDLAEACNISKATIYKFFESKEDLIQQIVLYYSDALLDKLKKIDEKDISPRDRFIEKITVQLQNFSFLQDIFMNIFPLIPKEQSFKYHSQFNKKNTELLEYFRECVISVFGDGIKPASWDVVVCMRGIMQVVQIYTRNKDIPDDKQKAEFIFNCTEAIALGRLGKESLFDENIINTADSIRPAKQISSLNDELDNIRTLINPRLPVENRGKLLSAVDMIAAQQCDPQHLIIDGMLAYLNGFDLLKPAVRALRNSLGGR